MAGIRLDGDIESIIATINDIGNLDLKSVNRVLSEALKSSNVISVYLFHAMEDPQGRKWEKSIRASEEGGQTLTETSDLKNSIRRRATGKGFVIGTNKKYAGTHQNGGRFTIRAKNKPCLRFKIGGRWISKKEVTIEMPKREFLGISEKDMDEIRGTLEDFVRENIHD